jgi:hypothetical protein
LVDPSPRADALKVAMGRIQERWGMASVATASQHMAQAAVRELPDAFPTGIAELDELTAIGGLPIGRLSLCLGDPGSGRMSLAYHLLAKASQATAAVLLVDLRGHLDAWLLGRLGARMERVLVVRPGGGDRLKTALEATLALVRSGVGCVVVDLPRRSGANPMWDPYAAALASVCGKESAAALVLAERAAEPLAYASSLTLRLQRAGWRLGHGDIAGVRVRVQVEKSKLGMPGATTEFELAYPQGLFIAPSRAEAAHLALLEDMAPQLEVLSA